MSSRLPLLIQRFSKSGEGVAEHQGRAVFVEGALPGEQVLAEVSSHGKVLRGQLLEVVTPSPARRQPPCTLAGSCGGCDWLHVAEAEQVAWKERIVASALERLGQVPLASLLVRPTVTAGPVLGYRRRATLHPVGGKLGFHGRRSHERVAVSHCPALTPGLAPLPERLAQALGPALKDLDEVRLLECEGRLSVSVHLQAAPKARHREALEALVREGVVDGAVLIPADGKGAAQVFGAPTLEEAGVYYRPEGFAQANVEVNRRLVQHAVDLLELDGTQHVLELYSGNGNFTFRLREAAALVVAVESAGISMQLAQDAVRKRALSGVRLMQGDSAKIAAGLLKERARFDRLFLDPPRTGAPGVGAWASGLLASRVVYVACDPVALARDAAELVREGYRPEVLQLFDLFPQTHHIEAVMSFSRAAAQAGR